METNKQDFAEKLNKKMDEKRITQSALAKRMGVTPTAIWNWEQGNSFPRERTLLKLAKILAVDADWLRSENAKTDDVDFNLDESETNLVDDINQLKEKIAEAHGIDPDDVKIRVEIVI